MAQGLAWNVRKFRLYTLSNGSLVIDFFAGMRLTDLILRVIIWWEFGEWQRDSTKVNERLEVGR